MGLQRQVSKGTREKPAKRTPDRPNSPVVARPRAQRLSPGEREALIVAGAVRYFAEAGFAGDTRSGTGPRTTPDRDRTVWIPGKWDNPLLVFFHR